LNTKEPTQN